VSVEIFQPLRSEQHKRKVVGVGGNKKMNRYGVLLANASDIACALAQADEQLGFGLRSV
jgi:hypothetical protein